MWRLAVLLCVIFLAGCPTTGQDTTCYPTHGFSNFTNYTFNPSYVAPQFGVEVDDPKGEIDILQLDGTLANVEQCMQQFVDQPLTAEESKASDCVGQVDTKVHSCLQIKLASDWHLSACTQEQVFSCNVGNQRCNEKGQTPTEQCPCSCRAIVQDNRKIILTPNLKLLPANLDTLMTGCLSPWSGRLAKCASPENIPAVP